MRANDPILLLAVMLGGLAWGCSSQGYGGQKRPGSEVAVVSGSGFLAYGTRIDFVDDRRFDPPQDSVSVLPGNHLLGVHLTTLAGNRHAGEVPFRAEAGRHYVARVTDSQTGVSGVPYDVWVEDSETGRRLPEVPVSEPAPAENSAPQPIP